MIFIIFLPIQYAIDFQLLGGIWILQTFPSVVLGLYRVPLRGGPLFLGWLVWHDQRNLVFRAGRSETGLANCRAWRVYIAIIALALNLVVSFGGSLLQKRL